LVYQNIATLMIETQGLPRESTTEEALQIFEGLVRDELPGALRASVGSVALQYKYMLCISLGATVPTFLDTLAGWHYGMRPRQLLNLTFWYGTCMLTLTPLFIALFAALCSYHLHLGSWQEWMWICTSATVLYAPIFALASASKFVHVWSDDSDLGLALFSSVFFASTLATLALVRGATYCRQQPRRNDHGVLSEENMSSLMRLCRTAESMASASTESFN